MAVRIGQALLHKKCLRIVSSHDQQFKDMKDIIIEVGEAGLLTAQSRSPTVADAPNWFLSNDDDEQSPAIHGCESRASLHEANIDLEAGLATFHCKRLSEVFPNVTNPIPEEPVEIIPIIIESTVIETQEKNEESSSVPLHSLSALDLTKTITPGQYVIPPVASLNTQSIIHSDTSYSILDVDGISAVAGLSKATRATKQLEEVPVCNEIRRQHLLDHQKHLDTFLIQQLKTIGLSCEWLDTIRPLILNASHTIATDVTPDDYMDICVYSKIKKIPGGRMSACDLIHGVVFSKHVTHKKMNLSLRNPRILLLKCAFEFQRKENQLSSFDTLLSQEQEYLKNLVERVKRVRPSIIFVQKSVSRYALDILHRYGIVVVVNIKPSVMARIARSTQADLVTNLDQLFFDIKLGACGHFYVRTYTLPDSTRKTLIYLDECETRLGGVILLQGGTKSVLKRVKKVVLFGIQVAHNMKLESSYLTDVLVKPSCRKVSDPDQSGYDTPPSTPTQALYCFSPSLLSEMVLEDEDVFVDEANGHVSDGGGGGDIAEGGEGDAEGGGGGDIEERSEVEGNEVNGDQEKYMATSEETFQSILSYHIISMSPYMSFSSPYLQTEQGMKAYIRVYLPSSIYWSYWFQPRANLYANPQCDLLPLPSSVTQPTDTLGAVSPAKHSYKSVSCHPFTQSSFLLPVNSKDFETSRADFKAALADFRARASLPDEPDSFFFLSAKRSANVYHRLQDIFASSRNFEIEAGDWCNNNNDSFLQLDEGESEVDGESETIQQNYSSLSSCAPVQESQLMATQSDVRNDEAIDSMELVHIGLTEVRE